MLIETKLGLAFVWQSQFCPRRLCGQLQKSWFRVLFCFTAEDSIYFLTTRFIHTRDYTSQAEILGFRSNCIFPLSLSSSQFPHAAWTGSLPKEEVLLLQLLGGASVLCHSCRLRCTPMLLKRVQLRWIVKILG